MQESILKSVNMMSPLLLVGVLFSLVGAEPVVHLKNGDIRGTTSKFDDGNEYFAFLGIPYAEPPTGDFRFKPPVPKKSWIENGVLDATKDGQVCTQFDILMTKSIIGSEDCLVLNVYTPQYVTPKKYPVMVWIHGGGFTFGHASSWMYGPSRFVSQDVVIVSFNYRLDVFGFLSTGDDVVKGNYGLLDQLEVLKWVKHNIHAFGGDPERVTLFGQSAGGVSTMYHVMSPLSEGLFQRAISLSGPIASWGIAEKPEMQAKVVAKIFKCPEESTALVECLKKLPAKEILQTLQPVGGFAKINFPPAVDGHFIPMKPKTAFEKGLIHNKIPVLTGIVKDEGVGIYAIVNPNIYKKCPDDVLKQIIRGSVNTEKDIPAVIELIEQEYLKTIDKSDQLSEVLAISNFLSDHMFDIPHYETVRHLTEANIETYSYIYEFQANYSFLSLLGIKDYLGVAHGDELWMMFDGLIFGPLMKNERVKQMAQTFVHLLTNFAKHGDATHDVDVKWPKSSQGNIQVYHIDEHPFVNKYNPNEDPRIEFWLKTIPLALKNTKDEL